MNGLDLFSGIGGISYALRDYVRPVAYCEIDRYCQGVLLSRMASEDIDNAPIWDDITTLEPKGIEAIDIIFGGFPCQDISIAGLGKGLAGERSGLFYEIVRLAKEIKPKFIFLENVPAITSRGGLQVVREITEMGYDCRWCVISAASVGALHKRERWFLLARHRRQQNEEFYTDTDVKQFASQQTSERNSHKRPSDSGFCENVAHSNSTRLGEQRRSSPREKEFNTLESCSQNNSNADSIASKQTDSRSIPEQREEGTRRGHTRQCGPFESREHWQEVVSGVCRVSDGIPFHVDRLRSLGNAVVPQQVKEAFEILIGIE